MVFDGDIEYKRYNFNAAIGQNIRVRESPQQRGTGTAIRPIVQFNLNGKSLCQITAIRSGGLEKMRVHALDLQRSLENGDVEVGKKPCYDKVDSLIAAVAESGI